MNGESSRYNKLESMLEGGSSEPHNVPLNYLRNITNNFSDERLLGEGGFGTVYMGVLQNGKAIAVKKFNSSIPGVKDRQFDNEANHLMRLKHPNVVVLVGWCSDIENIYVEYNGKYICAEKLERLLCLEYMPKGNLRGYLSDEFSGLGWDTRYKIIEGICYGLRYLHEECQTNAPIVHMDLKPANILLDNNMMPKIADFGLSRLFSKEKTWTCTLSRYGSLGYMSPEYINKGIISTKSDIFSLGVIIIEIVTGGRDYPDETGTSSDEFIETVLHNWSQRKRIKMLSGVSLEIDYPQIRRCIQIGLDCVKIDRFKRPTVSEIIKRLHGPESEDSSNIKRVHGPDEPVPLSPNMKWASPELLEFIGHMRDGDQSFISVFDAQTLLLEYIKKEGLRDPKRKSQIICDSRLDRLFRKPRVAHFEMLKLLEMHFPVNETSTVSDSSQVRINLNSAHVDTNGYNDMAANFSPDKRRRM